MTHDIIKQFCRVLLFLVLAYPVVVLLLFLFQRTLIYYPNSYEPTQTLLRAENLRMWPSMIDYRGLIRNIALSDPIGTVLVFHGNAGAAYHRSYYIEALSKLNYRVVLVEYPGYGGRGGQVSEQSFVVDGIEALETAYKQFGGPLYLWGESLGAGVVSSMVAKATVPIEGLVLLTPWDSLPAVARTHYWYFPTHWLITDRYNSIDNLKDYTGNVAVVLAAMDEVIPVQHGQRLYEAIDAPKKRWLFREAKHNSIPFHEDLTWWKEVMDFVSEKNMGH